jgi:hypothetical protein
LGGRRRADSSLRDIRRDQCLHLLVTDLCSASAHHNRHDRATASLDRSHNVEARRTDVARLDPIDALHSADQPVVASQRAAAEREGAGPEVSEVLGKAMPQGSAHHHHIARGAVLVRMGQPGGVPKLRVGHPESACGSRHPFGHRRFASLQALGDDHSHVIGGVGDHGFDSLVHAYGLAGP